jgi:hypothetical protein
MINRELLAYPDQLTAALRKNQRVVQDMQSRAKMFIAKTTDDFRIVNNSITNIGGDISAETAARIQADQAEAAARISGDAATLVSAKTYVDTEVAKKVNIAQGTSNAGMFLVVGSDGNVTLMNMNASELVGPYPTVADIPQPYDQNDLYLVGTSEPYAIYALVSGSLVMLGHTNIDLSNYYTKAETYSRAEVYNKNETYNKTEVYNKSETYNNTEVYNKGETYSKTEVYPKGDVYNKTEVYSKSETYPKGDVYNKTEVYNKNEVYAKTEVYNKNEVYSKSETYNKSEIENLVEGATVGTDIWAISIPYGYILLSRQLQTGESLVYYSGTNAGFTEATLAVSDQGASGGGWLYGFVGNTIQTASSVRVKK